MEQEISEWATKEELAKQLKIPLDTLDRTTTQLIDNKFLEEKNGKFRINNQDGKAKERVKQFLGDLDNRYSKDKYYPYIRHGYLHLKHKLEQKREFPKDVKEQSKKLGFDLEKSASNDLLEGAELFEIDEKTKWILSMTNNEIFKRNMPYPQVILDCDLKIDEKWFKGFFIGDGLVYTYWGDTDGYCDNALIFNTFEDKKYKDLEKHFLKDLKKSTVTKLKVFICNFFDFINNPEVRIIKLVRSEKNRQRRMRNGKEPLPSSNKIKITGTLKTYLEKPEFLGESFNYRFWVRGHFMRFWNKKKYRNLYQQLTINELPNEYYIDDKIRNNDKIIMRWVKPFIKGEGVLITKRYEVKK